MTTTEMSSQDREQAIRAEHTQLEDRLIFDAFNAPFAGHNTRDDSDAFLKLCDLWINGRMAIVSLPVGSTPYADAMRAENRAALNALSLIDGPQISVEVYPDQYNHSPDGEVSWAGPLQALAADQDQGLPPVWRDMTCQPHVNPAALEIGACPGYTTLRRFLEWGSVARWPYGYDMLAILINLENAFTNATWEDQA